MVFDLAYEAAGSVAPPGESGLGVIVKKGRVTLATCNTPLEALQVLSDQGGCMDEWEPPYKAIPFGAIIDVTEAE